MFFSDGEKQNKLFELIAKSCLESIQKLFHSGELRHAEAILHSLNCTPTMVTTKNRQRLVFVAKDVNSEHFHRSTTVEDVACTKALESTAGTTSAQQAGTDALLPIGG